MAATAAYIAVQDSSTTLSANDTEHSFSLFDAPALNVDRRPILSFRVHPLMVAGSVRLTMTLNGTQIVDQLFDTTEPRAWQEIVEANILEPELNDLKANMINVAFSGSIVLSDVVVLYTNI